MVRKLGCDQFDVLAFVVMFRQQRSVPCGNSCLSCILTTSTIIADIDGGSVVTGISIDDPRINRGLGTQAVDIVAPKQANSTCDTKPTTVLTRLPMPTVRSTLLHHIPLRPFGQSRIHLQLYSSGGLVLQCRGFMTLCVEFRMQYVAGCDCVVTKQEASLVTSRLMAGPQNPVATTLPTQGCQSGRGNRDRQSESFLLFMTQWHRRATSPKKKTGATVDPRLCSQVARWAGPLHYNYGHDDGV